MSRFRAVLEFVKQRPRGAAGIAVALGLAIWWKSPQLSYLLATACQHSAPDFAEQRAIDAIVWAGGDYPAAQICRSRLLLARGQFEEAVGAWLTIRRDATCPLNSLQQLASEALDKSQTRFALDVARFAAQQSPDNPATVEILIRALAASGDQQAAVQQSERLTRLTPHSVVAWTQYMELLRRLLQIVEAANAGETALQQAPTLAEEIDIRRTLSELYLTRSDAAHAAEHSQWILEHAPEPQPMDLIRRAYAFRLAHDSNAALKTVEKAIEREPDSLQGLMLRGFLFADSGRDAEAVADLERVLSAAPDHKETHYKLARCLMRLGQLDEARKHLQKSEELHEISAKLLGND